MEITAPILLPSDVIILPVTELHEEIKRQVAFAEGDYAITRPRSRIPSRIIDSQAATLLQEFRTAKTIVEAVILYSRKTVTPAEEALEAAFPMIKRLLAERLLVPADSQDAGEIIHFFEIGDLVAGFTVVRCLQELEDTELYHVKQANGKEAALKISRLDAELKLTQMFDREAAILQHLDGRVNPQLIEEGTTENRRYLALEWCPGVYVTTVAQELRQIPNGKGRIDLLKLCCTVLEAYAHLHKQGVIHSDIHPRNLLVDGNGLAKIIDYGLSRWMNSGNNLGKAPRGGVGFFFEPECAKALLAGQHPPASTFLGEQYSLAALTYLLLTGAYYLDFSLEKSEMLRQIAEDPMLPFSSHGARPLLEVEGVIAKALSKEPEGRFSSVSEFARSLREVIPQTKQDESTTIGSGVLQGSTAIDTLLKEVLDRVQISGSLFSSGEIKPPKCSVNFGAAGIAYALYRISCIRSDPTLLALADVWINRAMGDIGDDKAFFSAEMDITLENVGQISPYHTASGVYCVQAFISHSMGDIQSQYEAIERFILASKAPCDNLDLTLGRSASLLACSLLLDITPEHEALRAFGMETMIGIWDQVNTFAPIPECPDVSYLGIAHGWAGILYAALRWCQTTGVSLPGQVPVRLEQLGDLAESKGRGVRWQVLRKHNSKRGKDYMSGWCHGSAGYIHLWTLAHQLFCNERYLALANKAAWNAWEEPDTISSLCCGLAGRSYGLLNLYKYTGEKDWVSRAQQLANQAALGIKAKDLPIDSLYKGQIGVAVLSADLSRPELSCMPFFEPEGWPSGKAH